MVVANADDSRVVLGTATDDSRVVLGTATDDDAIMPSSSSST
jgi:hypothetical protein